MRNKQIDLYPFKEEEERKPQDDQISKRTERTREKRDSNNEKIEMQTRKHTRSSRRCTARLVNLTMAKRTRMAKVQNNSAKRRSTPSQEITSERACVRQEMSKMNTTTTTRTRTTTTTNLGEKQRKNNKKQPAVEMQRVDKSRSVAIDEEATAESGQHLTSEEAHEATPHRHHLQQQQ